MKMNFRKISAGLCSAIILSTGIAYAAPEMIQAFNQSEFTIKVNGKTQVHPEGLKPIVYNNRTYLPAGFIAELLGAKVEFDSKTKIVNIDSNENTLHNEENLIVNYEKEIENLKLEIEKLKSESNQVQHNYNKFPSRITKDGFSITLEGLSVNDSNDGRLFFTIKNDNFESSIKLVPMDTILEIDGTKYTAQLSATDTFNPSIFQWVSEGSTLSGVIPFRKLPDDKDIQEMKVTIFYETNERIPQKSSHELYIIND